MIKLVLCQNVLIMCVLFVRSASSRTAVLSRLRNCTFSVRVTFEQAFRIKASPSTNINYSLFIINYFPIAYADLLGGVGQSVLGASEDGLETFGHLE